MTEPEFHPFDSELRRILMDAARNLRASGVPPWNPLGEAFGGPAQSERPTLSAVKYGYLLPVLNETLMDEGLIPDTREPVKVSRYRHGVAV